MSLKVVRRLAPSSSAMLLIVLLVGFAVVSGGATIAGQNLQNVAQQAALLAPVSFGETVVLIAGGLDLSVGAVMAMSAALAIGLQPSGVVVAVLAALGFGILAGVINGLLVTRARIAPFIVTLGSLNLVTGLLLTYTHQQPIAGTMRGFTVLGAGTIGFIPVPMLIALGFALALHGMLRYTRLGRNMYAAGGNADAAFVAGVQVGRTQFASYVVSGGMAAVSGVLLASSLNAASAQVGFDTQLLALTAAIIGGASLLGGRGGVGGAFIGVVVLSVLNNGMDLLGVPTYYQIGTRALVLIIVVALDSLYALMAQRRLEMFRFGTRPAQTKERRSVARLLGVLAGRE